MRRPWAGLAKSTLHCGKMKSITTTHTPHKGFKLARVVGGIDNGTFNTVVVELTILHRSNAHLNRSPYQKARCGAAFVERIYSPVTGKEYKSAYSFFDNDFVYIVGRFVVPVDFDPDLTAQCTAGIHYFPSLSAALGYTELAAMEAGWLQRLIRSGDGFTGTIVRNWPNHPNNGNVFRYRIQRFENGKLVREKKRFVKL